MQTKHDLIVQRFLWKLQISSILFTRYHVLIQLYVTTFTELICGQVTNDKHVNLVSKCHTVFTNDILLSNAM